MYLRYHSAGFTATSYTMFYPWNLNEALTVIDVERHDTNQKDVTVSASEILLFYFFVCLFCITEWKACEKNGYGCVDTLYHTIQCYCNSIQSFTVRWIYSCYNSICLVFWSLKIGIFMASLYDFNCTRGKAAISERNPMGFFFEL